MLDENPNHIQSWRDSSSVTSKSKGSPPTPLVLIHDGGGTTFAYFSLDEVHRDLWGVHNPHFETGEVWAGGMDEMARTYVGLLKGAGIRGRILLGGWSLGGYLSIAMAHILLQEEAEGKGTIHVAGLLIIDSPMHLGLSNEDEFAPPNVGGWPKLVQACYDQCPDLLRSWRLPSWKSTESNGEATGEAAEYVDQKSSLTLPPAVLLRCTQRTPVKDSAKGPARVDKFRDEPMLGWKGRYPHFIQSTIDVDAHHYNLFEFSKIEPTTGKINDALKILDKFT